MEIAVRLFLTTIILTLLAQPAFAELIFYCETTDGGEITSDGFEKKNNQNFNFVVTKGAVNFGEGGFASKLTLKTTLLNLETGAFAADARMDASPDTPLFVAKFAPPHLFFATVSFRLVQAFHATCDRV